MKNKIYSGTARRLMVPGVSAVVFAALLSLFATPLRAADRQVLAPGHVPSLVSGLQPVERLAASQQMRLAIGLPLPNQQALTARLQQIYNPTSPNYRRYLTPQQFAETFGPTEEDYQKVVDFARANGLVVLGTHPNRMLLDVSGRVADVEKAFQVTMNVYRHPSENRTFFSPSNEPSVPSGLPVLDISGLNDFIRPHPKYRLAPANVSANASPKVGSGPMGNYIGYDFRAAYVPGVSLTGSGQAVGLLQFDGYDPRDIAAYANLAGLPNVPLENVLLDGFNGQPSGTGGEVEVSLDIEMSMSMAPGLSKIIVYMAGPSGTPNDILNRMATDNSASQLSCSWGWSGGPQATTEQIFLQMAAQGQTFFNASGDSDAFRSGQVDSPSYAGSPSSSPNITQVGGTTLSTAGPGGAWLSETVWNWGIEVGTLYDGVGSSGGISSYYPIPSWQQNVDMSANMGSTTMRNIPDVALTADNVYVIADSGNAYPGTGGTSCAAPLWAGFAALVNQAAVQGGGATIGFINPSLYAIGESSSAAFHDVATGDNTWSGSKTLFPAVPGYDLCTGWGTPNGVDLIYALAGSPPRNGFLQMTVDPPTGSALISSSTQAVFVAVSDIFGVTNATIVAYVSGATNLDFDFRNDGVPPDVTTNDFVYSGQFVVPSSASTLSITLVATAPGEIGVTNTVNYLVIAPPSNDNFANATKVPVAGGTYVSNNRFATIEQGEPEHAGDTNYAASLWWLWSPTTSTNVLIDTTGSAVDTVVAVYTGSTLSGLKSVASANDQGAQKQAYLNFNATAGTSYHVAVAGADANALGSIKLRIAPGGQLDTTAPQISIASPRSGLPVSGRLINVAGVAADPSPDASGIREVVVSVNGSLSGVASGTTNWSAFVALKEGANAIQVRSYDFAGNSSVPATAQVYYIPSSGNDLFANAFQLNGTSGTSSVSNTNATKEVGEPIIANNTGGKSVWWNWQAPADGVLFLSTTNSDFDTIMGLFIGDRVNALTTIASNDDAYDGVSFSKIMQAVRSNQVYRIAVDGYNGSSGNVALSYSFSSANVSHVTIGALQGGSVVPGSGDYAVGSTLTLTATPDFGYQFVGWQGAVSSTDNPLSIVVNADVTLTASFQVAPVTDGFESGSFSALPWVSAGARPWTVETNVVSFGQYAAQSGAITDNQFSSLSVQVNSTGGTGSFDYKVSSEANWDLLTFYLNGVPQKAWSGEAGWATYLFQIPAGLVTLEWRYSKDASTSMGLDAAFIDNVNLPVVATSLQLVNPTTTGFQIQVQGPPNQTVLVQSSTNLTTWRT
ncbi:MAG TPA: protease pro-enzyme activation domain-containing protein, partial [Candidatus Nitrosotalea sp.]|nr:protease pro-enzyme activation domain-containing protein [Candidatus Nitrosotalea sp.]